ncbi:MAG: hypothetical protein SGJ17_11305 [Hyphomicrobiales bacterium]|nr:hypothetical protein [Hyphomicrobiales bacterium]
MKTIITGLSLAGVMAVVAACGSPQALQNDANLQTPNLQLPAGGITPVKDVIVTPRENDTIEFTAAASGAFKFEQLTAVMWCRASQHAKANKFADWQPIRSEQLRPASADAPMIGRGLVQMLRSPAPLLGKKQSIDWCKDAPQIAAVSLTEQVQAPAQSSFGGWSSNDGN